MPRRRTCIPLALLCAFAAQPAGAVPLAQGEVLVAHGAEILRVDPDTGDWSVFSPPPAGTNRIPYFTRSMVIDPAGPVFVTTSDYKLIEIDRNTGEQTEVHKRGLFCLNGACIPVDQGVLDVGSQPAGLAIASNSTRSDHRALYVSSGDGLWRVTRTRNGKVTSAHLESDVQTGSPSIDLLENDGALIRVLISKGFTINSWDPSNGQVYLYADPDGLVAAIEYHDGDLFFTTQDIGCTATAAGVWLGKDEPDQLTYGGFLRCPNDIVVDPEVPLRLWIAEDLGRLVRVDYNGVNWAQTLVADFEEAAGSASYNVAVVPEYVPEPGAWASAAAITTALALVTRGRRAAPRRLRSR